MAHKAMGAGDILIECQVDQRDTLRSSKNRYVGIRRCRCQAENAGQRGEFCRDTIGQHYVFRQQIAGDKSLLNFTAGKEF